MKPMENKYRLIVEHLPEAFAYHRIVADNDGNPVDYIFVDVNGAFEEMTGLKKDALVGKKMTELHPHFNKFSFDWIGIYGKVALTEKDTCFEQYYEHEDRWYKITVCSHTPGFIATLFHDITESKRSEKALHKVEEKYRLLVENAYEAVVVARDGWNVFCNPMAVQLFGRSESEIRSTPFIEFIHPHDRTEVMRRHLNRMDGEVTQERYSFRIVTGSGSIKWVEANAAVIQWEGKNATLVLISDITERKKAEKALKESEERFRYISEFSPLPLSIVDSKGNYEYINLKFTEVFGYTLDDIPTGKVWHELVYPDAVYRQQLIEIWKKDVEDLGTDEVRPRVFTVTCKDGLKKEILFRPVLMDNGKHLIIFEDITELKQAEEALKFQLEMEKVISEISYTFVNFSSEQTDDCINYALKLTGKLLNIDRSYIFKFSPDGKMSNAHEWCKSEIEPQLNNLQDIPLDQFPWWMEKLKRFDTINIPCVAKMPLQAASEKAILQFQSIQSVTAVPIYSANKLLGFMGFDSVNKEKSWAEEQLSLLKVVAEIISSALVKQQAEKELFEREALKQLLMKLATDFVNVPLERVDAAINEMLEAIGKFTKVDRAYIYNHDYSRQVSTITHEWCEDGITPEIENKQAIPFDLLKDVLKTLQKGEIVHINNVAEVPENHEMRLLLENNGIKSLLLFPLMRGDSCIGFVGFDAVRELRYFKETERGLLMVLAELITNIVERRKNEEDLQKLNLELEQRVQERTAELEAINKELDAFCYSVSHDLRAPLRSIEGFSQALLEDYADGLDDQGRDYLTRVCESSQRMDELINDLLKLSHVTRLEMCLENVDLSSMATDCLARLQEQEPHRQVDTVIAPGINATGDTSMLRIVMENLLGNAWKYTSKLERAHIEFGATAETGQTVCYIRDNGAGFNMDYEEKIFQAFQRLHDSREYAGTGIGLSIVARIMLRHGGEIWAQGDVGRGAVFYFTLPQLKRS